ncbi:hypothetical protein EVAR_95499_1 [Eumeta japonica]|uniref:Uncharacterized protein n=1 Tax=Eumeta variegata TaxID=151549 RepID=A0A4C1UIS9_EUMVA|nr:hypothetical protein EVAR_95499_1 [Eumeta japonica]
MLCKGAVRAASRPPPTTRKPSPEPVSLRKSRGPPASELENRCRGRRSDHEKDSTDNRQRSAPASVDAPTTKRGIHGIKSCIPYRIRRATPAEPKTRNLKALLAHHQRSFT